jgi:2-polyprenyl-3-methyl-5-hydroxy-6-metoxy-1,4-benzoquinol methylase
MRNGGTNVDRETYYDNLGATYWNANEQLDAYHEMRMSSFLSLVDLFLPAKSNVFDFGCGTGETIVPLVERGFSVSGCDISQTMVDAAKTIPGVGTITKGGVEAVETIKSINNVIALNVLPYLTEEEEDTFWGSLSNSMSSGSVVIGSHTNMLFDLFTFNRYTMEFYRDHMLQYFPAELHDYLMSSLSKLITNPNTPDKNNQTWLGASNNPAASERDKIPKRRVCPFEYPDHVKTYGFKLLALKPVNVFPFPPLVTEKSKNTVLVQQKAQSAMQNKVMAKLLCSQFQFAFSKT